MTELARGRQRCYLVYAVAPDGVTARQANDLLNEYIEDRRRGFVIFHDHFTGKPHGGFAVLDVRDAQAYELLEDHGPLEGWDLAVPRTDVLPRRNGVRRPDGAHGGGLRARGSTSFEKRRRKTNASGGSGVTELADGWYRDRLSSEWQCRSPQEAGALFAEIGLSGSFWALG